MKIKLGLLLVLIVTIAAAPFLYADQRILIKSENHIEADGNIFTSLEEYVESSWFKENGKRCGTKMSTTGTASGRHSRSASDCTQNITSISNEYYPDQAVLIIPVYFHVITNTSGTGNVTDQQINDQIAVLNEDYRAMAETMGSNGFDTMIQFELAGIDRTVNNIWFNDFDEWSYKTFMGKDQTKYLNVYTNSASGFLGYSYFPQSHAGTVYDGVVILYQTVGGRNNGYSQYDQGRTLVHEIGHYLGLCHTFENKGYPPCGNTYSSGDLIADTPPESEAHYGCSISYTCSTPDAIHNYMNYTSDTCMYEFTKEQANRMVCSLLNYRSSLYKAGTPLFNYYVPVFKHQPDNWSGLGMTNLNSSSSASVKITVYDQNGLIIDTESKTIAAGGQSAFLAGTALGVDGWVKVTSDQMLAGLNFLGEYEDVPSDYFIADVPFTDTLFESLLIPHVAHNLNWDTVLFPSNPNNATATVTITYTNPAGESLTPYVTTIPAYGCKEISMGTVSNGTSIEGGSVNISSNQGLSAFALYNNLKKNNYSYAGINAVNTLNAGMTYYLPVFKPEPDFWSGLGITNLSSSDSAEVVITVYDQSGTVQTTEDKTIPAKGQEKFIVGTSLTSAGWIKVTSDQNIAGLNFLGEYDTILTGNYYLADVPFTQTLSTSMVIPHCAQNETWTTIVFIANPNPVPSTTTLTYTNKSGTASTPYFVTIPANGSIEVGVDAIAGSTDIKGGFVSITSENGLSAFALYNNLKTNNYSYAGINAVNLSE